MTNTENNITELTHFEVILKKNYVDAFIKHHLYLFTNKQAVSFVKLILEKLENDLESYGDIKITSVFGR
jgi:nucleoid DNA-binding protein